MRRTGFTLVQIVVTLVILVLLAVFLSPIFIRTEGGRRIPCQSNLKQMILGLKQYSQDWDETWPHVSSGVNVGWADAIYPYIKSTQVFACPSAQIAPRSNSTKKGFLRTDYFYNVRLDGVKERDIDTTSMTIAFGDGLPNSPTNIQLSALPFSWSQAEKSPARRHLDCANYAFADGHVKLLRPEKVTALPPKEGQSTFAIQ